MKGLLFAAFIPLNLLYVVHLKTFPLETIPIECPTYNTTNSAGLGCLSETKLIPGLNRSVNLCLTANLSCTGTPNQETTTTTTHYLCSDHSDTVHTVYEYPTDDTVQGATLHTCRRTMDRSYTCVVEYWLVKNFLKTHIWYRNDSLTCGCESMIENHRKQWKLCREKEEPKIPSMWPLVERYVLYAASAVVGMMFLGGLLVWACSMVPDICNAF